MANRSATVGCLGDCNFAHGENHLRGRAQGIVPCFHRCRSRMRVLPRPDAVVPALAERAVDDTDYRVLAFEHRTLLDVRLEVRIEGAMPHCGRAGVTDAIECLTERH